MKFRFVFLFALFFILLAGIGFSDKYIDKDISEEYLLDEVEQTYMVVNNINVTGNGCFTFPTKSVDVIFRCRDYITISVNSNALNLFNIKGRGFTLQNCRIKYVGGSTENAVYIDTAEGTTTIKDTNFDGFASVIKVKNSGILNLSNITSSSKGLTGVFLMNDGEATISGKVTISDISSESKEFIDFSTATLNEGADISVTNAYGGDVEITSGSANNNKIMITNSTLKGLYLYTGNITITNSKINNVLFSSISGNEISVYNTTAKKYELYNLSGTNFKLDSSTVSGSANTYLIYSKQSKVDFNIVNSIFTEGTYGLYIDDTSSEITLYAKNNNFTNVDTAYYLRPKAIKKLSIQKDIFNKEVSTAIDAKNIFGKVSIDGGASENKYPNMYFDNIQNEISLSGISFKKNNYPRFSNCNSMPENAKIAAKDLNLVEIDYENFLTNFVDEACHSKLVAIEDTVEINEKPFLTWNADFQNYSPDELVYDGKSGKEDLSVAMSYKAPIKLTGINVDAVSLLGPLKNNEKVILGDIDSKVVYGTKVILDINNSNIKKLKLNRVNGNISTNKLGNLILENKSNIKIYDNNIGGLECSALASDSAVDFNVAKNTEKTNILGKKGIGGNWWAGFSDDPTECKNDNNDAFCDAPYTFSCGGKDYTDYLPLTSLLGSAPAEEDKSSEKSGGGGGGSGGKSCTENSDCADNESCVSGKCTLLKCASGQKIHNHACVDCIADADCAADAHCVSGKCTPLQCKSGQKIHNHACVDCIADADCATNAKCVSGKCEILICKDNEKAENHKCVPKEGSAGALGETGKPGVDVNIDVNKGVDINVSKKGSKSKSIAAWIKKNKTLFGIIGGIVGLLIIILIVMICIAKHKKGKIKELEETIAGPSEPSESEEPPEEPDSENSEELDESSWSK